MTRPNDDAVATFVEGQLSWPQMRALEAHGDSSQSCRRLLTNLDRTINGGQPSTPC